MGFEAGEPHNVQLQSIRWVRKSIQCNDDAPTKAPNDDSEVKRGWAISFQSEALLVQQELMAFINAFYQQHKGKGHIIACTAPSSTAL
jgi:hypothetical protein